MSEHRSNAFVKQYGHPDFVDLITQQRLCDASVIPWQLYQKRWGILSSFYCCAGILRSFKGNLRLGTKIFQKPPWNIPRISLSHRPNFNETIWLSLHLYHKNLQMKVILKKMRVINLDKQEQVNVVSTNQWILQHARLVKTKKGLNYSPKIFSQHNQGVVSFSFQHFVKFHEKPDNKTILWTNKINFRVSTRIDFGFYPIIVFDQTSTFKPNKQNS